MWVIPLPGGRSSVGAVFDRADHPTDGNAAQALQDQIDSCPALKAAMHGMQPEGDVSFEADYAYEASHYAGENWFLAGDAGAFLDPAFSTGVHLAIVSGWAASEAILDGTAKARRRYNKALHRRVRLFDKFATGFYDLDFRDILFTPEPTPAVLRSVTSVLAGLPPETFADRFRVGLFHTLAKLQRRLPLSKRLHRPEASGQ
jgi:flavin-dependent dehydrogenase